MPDTDPWATMGPKLLVMLIDVHEAIVQDNLAEGSGNGATITMGRAWERELSALIGRARELCAPSFVMAPTTYTVSSFNEPSNRHTGLTLDQAAAILLSADGFTHEISAADGLYELWVSERSTNAMGGPGNLINCAAGGFTGRTLEELYTKVIAAEWHGWEAMTDEAFKASRFPTLSPDESGENCDNCGDGPFAVDFSDPDIEANYQQWRCPACGWWHERSEPGAGNDPYPAPEARGGAK